MFLQSSAIGTIPSIKALALPMTVVGNSALSMASTASRTAFQSAMSSVPTGNAEAGSVFALAVVTAARVAEFRRAVFTSPSRVTNARLADATAVGTTVKITDLCEKVCRIRIQI